MNTKALTVQHGPRAVALLALVAALGCSRESPPSLRGAMEDASGVATKAWIEGGADVNAKDEKGRTLLHAAAFQGQLTTVEYLVEHGADLDARTTSGITPLHAAVLNDHVAIAVFLIERGAAVNTRKTKNGRSPLDVARSDDMRNLLIEHGAKPGAQLP